MLVASGTNRNIIAERTCKLIYDCMSTFYVIRNGAQPLLCKETAEILEISFITVPDRSYGTINTIGDVQEIDLPEVEDKVPFPKIKEVNIHLDIKEGFV
uniref:CSON006368 protein n=1 Tax=Culicoides sonorensis TaxID=179676 RepID=A0A336JZR4_CULSO